MFSIRIHNGGRFHKFSGIRYVDGAVDIFDMVDIGLFSLIELDEIVLYTHGKDFVCDSVTPRSIPHGMLSPRTDEPIIIYTQLSGVQALDIKDHVLLTTHLRFSAINLSFISVQPTVNQVIDDVIRHISFDDMELDGDACFGDVASTQEEDNVSEVPNDHVVNESNTHVDVEPGVDVVRTKERIVKHVRVDEVVHGSGQESVEQGNGGEFVEHGSG
ncbi:hypothetical protein Tco_0974049 [Tanacetum coccineum]|uniref:Uncharacterized protein n=1 Tax=Tanacetum coccineum TaxID=301880 RepID=A0ABQ5EBE4_9ASTR